MTEISDKLKGFARRVRMVRSWKGMAMGACIGAGISAVWAVLDWVGVAYTEWAWMGALVASGAVLGTLAGYLGRVPAEALSRSIDRRAKLEDRLSTAAERREGHTAFDEAQRSDAESSLASLQPKSVYPIRAGKWHGGAVAFSALAAAIFLLGNSPIWLSDDARKEREELQQQGKKIERVTREELNSPEAHEKMSEAQKKLADDLRKLQRDLEKAHMSKAEALQKANEIEKQAQDLIQQTSKDAQKNLDTAKKALEKMQQDALTQAGMPNVTPQQANMSNSERAEAMRQQQQKMDQMQSLMNSLQNQLSQVEKKLKDPNLSAAERKALEEQKKALEKQLGDAKKGLEDAKKEMEALKLSADAQKLIEKMMSDPLYKELQALAQKLSQSSQAAEQSGQPSLTKEQQEALRKELEELMEKLKDDKAMKEYLKALLEAMKNAAGTSMANSLCMGLQPLIPIPGSGGPGTHERMMKDIGMVNHSEHGGEGKGKGNASMVTGQQRPTVGEQAYVEIKAPTTVGNRSSVPYVKVLPSYRKKAESALGHQQIPKEYEKRVKEYFESLGR